MKYFLLRLITILLFSQIGSAYAQSTGQIYSETTLRKWQAKYKVSTNHILKEWIYPKLSSSEKARFQQVYVHMPMLGEMKQEPMVFYRQGNRITISAHSMKFFDDLMIALAWYSLKKKDLSKINDYVSSLRYKQPSDFPGGRFPTPFEALGIPSNVLADKEVNNISIHYLNSFRTFILAHELAHIAHQHQSYHRISQVHAREQEREADAFALDVMARLHYFPIGAIHFFELCSHLGWGYKASTHPLDSERLAAVAQDLRKRKYDFAKDPRLGGQGSASSAIDFFAEKVTQLSYALSDNEVHEGLSLSGRSRKSHASTQGMHLYSGTYIRYDRGKKVMFPVKVWLRIKGTVVNGYFDFGVGRGEITQGRLQNGVIYYSWNWYYQSGKGTFTLSNQGNHIRGQWGYSQYGRASSNNGGEWILTKEVSQAQSLIRSMR